MNTRKTECGAGQFLTDLAVRAAPFALMPALFMVRYHLNGIGRARSRQGGEFARQIQPWILAYWHRFGGSANCFNHLLSGISYPPIPSGNSGARSRLRYFSTSATRPLARYSK